MEQEKSCIYVPLWLIVIGLFVLSFFGCTHMAIDVMDCEEEPFVHSCPEQGHGACHICTDGQYDYDEEVVVLD